MAAPSSTPEERVELLLTLAASTTFPHEAHTAFVKACLLMKLNYITLYELSPQALATWQKLATLHPGEAQGIPDPFTGQSSTPPPPGGGAKAGPKGGRHSNQKYTTHVNQSGLHRDVPDHEWTNRTCNWCGQTYSYESYPGNPRQYCSPACKKAKTGYDAKYRMRRRRAANSTP